MEDLILILKYFLKNRESKQFQLKKISKVRSFSLDYSVYNLISRSQPSLSMTEASSRTSRQRVRGKECDSSLNGYFQRSFQQIEQIKMTENLSSFEVKCSFGLSRGFVSSFIISPFIFFSRFCRLTQNQHVYC